MNIDNSCSFFTKEQIKKIEERYKGTYVFESPLRDKEGRWTSSPAAIFYTKKKHKISKSNYFAIFRSSDGLIICNGQSATTEPVTGLTDGYNVVYSHHVHDYRELGNNAIDGGRDYIRVIGNDPQLIKLKVVKDQLVAEEQ
jgi:hypothetical protein